MLLSQVAAGLPDAMEECLSRYGGLVWSLARTLSPTHHDAEEAVQEIFLDVWRHAGRFDPAASSETTFVAMIARRRLSDRHRRRQSRVQPGPLPMPSSIPDTGPFRLDRCDDVELVVSLLGQLRPEERRVLELAIGEGRTQAQVGAELGIPLGTVKSLARRGLLKLRHLVEADRQTSDPRHGPPHREPSR